MGNFEKLSVLVIVVIIVMILVVALYTWTDRPDTQINSSDANDGASYVVGDENDARKSLMEDDPYVTDENGEIDPYAKLLDDTDDLEFPDPKVTEVIDPPSDEPTTDADTVWIYEVQPGDTLNGIAQEQLSTIRRVNEIYELNPGLSEFLRRGQKLNMPPQTLSGGTPGTKTSDGTSAPLTPAAVADGMYTTRKGDTWEKISKRVFKTSDRWHLIWAKNSASYKSAEAILPAGVQIQLPN